MSTVAAYQRHIGTNCSGAKTLKFSLEWILGPSLKLDERKTTEVGEWILGVM